MSCSSPNEVRPKLLRPVEMPLYQCHKKVRALKITQVIKHAHPDPNYDDAKFEASAEFQGAHLFFEGYFPLPVDAAWYRKHNPSPGNYYVLYEDGYTSCSPGPAFEAGYTAMEPGSSHVTFVGNCARCGGDHEEVAFKPFSRALQVGTAVEWTHWAACPTTGEPILMRQSLTSKQCPAQDQQGEHPSKTDGVESEMLTWEQASQLRPTQDVFIVLPDTRCQQLVLVAGENGVLLFDRLRLTTLFVDRHYNRDFPSPIPAGAAAVFSLQLCRHHARRSVTNLFLTKAGAEAEVARQRAADSRINA